MKVILLQVDQLDILQNITELGTMENKCKYWQGKGGDLEPRTYSVCGLQDQHPKVLGHVAPYVDKMYF